MGEAAIAVEQYADGGGLGLGEATELAGGRL
jgi:hypothetical protein